MKKITIMLIAFLSLFLVGCENLDLKQVSDADLERISEKAIICNDPYMRVGVECCLDGNNNNICDRDETTNKIKESSAINEKPKKELTLDETTFCATTTATYIVDFSCTTGQVTVENRGSLDILDLTFNVHTPKGKIIVDGGSLGQFGVKKFNIPWEFISGLTQIDAISTLPYNNEQITCIGKNDEHVMKYKLGKTCK